jgi:CMP/dCMP kinase
VKRYRTLESTELLKTQGLNSNAVQGDGLVITIDGPAGAGKSTVARMLAEQLGFEFLDTGAMYRCVTLAVLRAGISLSDNDAVMKLATKLTIEFCGTTVLMNGEDVTRLIRSPEVASSIGTVADNVAVRCLLSELQRDWAKGRWVVTEGRDQGTEVFHDSPCKIFLVAGSQERARRRKAELAERGIELDLDAVLSQQNRRDHEDRSRAVGALRKADDALEFCTDGRSLEEVVRELRRCIEQKLASISSDAAQISAAGRAKGDAQVADPQVSDDSKNVDRWDGKATS